MGVEKGRVEFALEQLVALRGLNDHLPSQAGVSACRGFSTRESITELTVSHAPCFSPDTNRKCAVCLETMELYRQVSHTTQEALALPPKYLRMYGDFVTKNASAVGQIEGALRSLTYILPGTDSCLT